MWSSSAAAPAVVRQPWRRRGPAIASSLPRKPTGSAASSPPRPCRPMSIPGSSSSAQAPPTVDCATAIRDYYRRHYPLTAEARAVESLNPGNGSVSRLCHEPRVALAVLHGHARTVRQQSAPRSCSSTSRSRPTSQGDRVEAVTVRDLRSGRERCSSRPILSRRDRAGRPAAAGQDGVRHRRRGAEGHRRAARPRQGPARTTSRRSPAVSRSITSTGRTTRSTEPAEYDFWRNYVPALKPAWPGPLLSWQMSEPITLKERKPCRSTRCGGTGSEPLALPPHRRPPQFPARHLSRRTSALVNWPQNDYWLGNLMRRVGGGGRQALARAKQLSLSLLYWLQTEAPRPDGKTGWKGLRLRTDIVGTEDGLAKYPYIRESRRIKAEFTVAGAARRHRGTHEGHRQATATR